ncbi:MAG: hypothetical protein Kapaf2KO_05250 [Candidatus Kapaibacteriales bacterium]
MFIYIVAFLFIVFIIAAVRIQSKLQKEKKEGKWDFILREFLPYLKSHSEPVKTSEELSLKSTTGFSSESFIGKLHYNSAGVLVEKTEPLSAADFSEVIFVRGKDVPSKFNPVFESYYYSLEENDKSIILKLKDNNSNNTYDYELIIKYPPEHLYLDIKSVFES